VVCRKVQLFVLLFYSMILSRTQTVAFSDRMICKCKKVKFSLRLTN
jgi:hypothetical protein